MKLHQNYREINCPSLYTIKPIGLAVEYCWVITGIFRVRKASKYISFIYTNVLKSATLKELHKL